MLPEEWLQEMHAIVSDLMRYQNSLGHFPSLSKYRGPIAHTIEQAIKWINRYGTEKATAYDYNLIVMTALLQMMEIDSLTRTFDDEAMKKWYERYIAEKELEIEL